MATLQFQDVFEPYYAGREKVSPGEEDGDNRVASGYDSDTAQQRRLRLEAARRRFVSASPRLPVKGI